MDSNGSFPGILYDGNTNTVWEFITDPIRTNFENLDDLKIETIRSNPGEFLHGTPEVKTAFEYVYENLLYYNNDIENHIIKNSRAQLHHYIATMPIITNVCCQMMMLLVAETHALVACKGYVPMKYISKEQFENYDTFMKFIHTAGKDIRFTFKYVDQAIEYVRRRIDYINEKSADKTKDLRMIIMGDIDAISAKRSKSMC